MEESKREEELAPDLRLQTVLQVLLGKVAITSLEVGPHSSGWLGGELHRILEYGDGEVVCRHGRQEQSEVLMNAVLLFSEVQDNLLKRWHPGFSQVTVLEHDPRAILGGRLDQLLSLDTLTLTQ